MRSPWLWWCSVIVLLLRSVYGGDELEVEKVELTTLPPQPQTAEQLGVPRCISDYDCVRNGVCRKGADGYGRCLCPQSCPAYIPMQCKRAFRRQEPTCFGMNDAYTKRFDLHPPICHQARCACPPMFDPVVPPKTFPHTGNDSFHFLPTRCDKRELAVVGVVVPSRSVYKGTDATLHCCVNMDPSGVVDTYSVKFVQNTTVIREPTSHPFEKNNDMYDELNGPSCWSLHIVNVQLHDTGSYMCHVTPVNRQSPTVNFTIQFEVKERPRLYPVWVPHHQHRRAKKGRGPAPTSPAPARTRGRMPQMIQNLTVHATTHNATVTWDEQGNDLRINLKLLRRSDKNGQTIYQQENAKSPIFIEKLRPAVPYTLFVTVIDGHSEPLKFTENFQTAESTPHAPRPEEVRVLNSGQSLMCEVEWRSPAVTNGRISNYYVRVQGVLRNSSAVGDSLVADHFPGAGDGEKCANYDASEDRENGINPVDFNSEFLACKYGPLKANRNYTVTLWARNAAGMSAPVGFEQSCVTNYAEPEQVPKPVSRPAANHTAFSIAFPDTVDETNGPVSCYYVAVVPLHANVSIDSLPPPGTIVMDSFAKAFSNNLSPAAAAATRYFAYVAESYSRLPQGTETLIGDGVGLAGIEPCNMLYLSRYKTEDSALRAGLKYTGYLIVRVDKEQSRREDGRWSGPPGRKHRQLQLSGPAYGYSAYFKPVYLQPENEANSWSAVVSVLLSVLLFVAAAGGAVVYFLHRRGGLSSLCPLSKEEAERRPLDVRPRNAIPVDDLHGEYVMRKRDSDFLFTQEYDNLPHYSLECSASKAKENQRKNRYNDIRAFDETRVKLKKLQGLDHSDYINANHVSGWRDRKKFIAAQAPTENTVADFWRMVWEQEASLVVMVCNLTERNRAQCVKYWPDDEPQQYGQLVVNAVKADYFADYAVRSFDVHPVGAGGGAGNRGSSTSPALRGSDFGSAGSDVGSEYANVPSGKREKREETDRGATRRIVQFHFTNWNDYKAPECSTGLLRFLHRLRARDDYNHSKVVTHCSAGVGRTGTLIAIDAMLDQAEAEGKVDVFGFVAGLRKQRNLMVQTPEQYSFIYKALCEWHLFGNTDMDVEEFEQHYRQLLEPLPRRSRVEDDDCPSGMHAEFKKLSIMLEAAPPPQTFAKQDDNIMKNRFDEAVPYDRNRVVLSPTIGYADTSYINASQIKGYFYPYILAQDPMCEATCFDFWRMVHEKSVATLVMLSQEEDFAHSEKYWPSSPSHPMQLHSSARQVVVELTHEERHPTYVRRELTYKINTDASSHSVTQFSFLAWPSGAPAPTSVEALLSLIGRVLEHHSSHPESGAIVLHCRDGSSQSGVYCCVSLLLERLRAEARVDVLQTARGLRSQRPRLFTQAEQYAFVYRAVASYLRRRD